MENNKNHNGSGINDGIVLIAGFMGMAVILFFVAFNIGKETGKRDRTDLDEFMEQWMESMDGATEKLESIENKIADLEGETEELEKKIDGLQTAEPEENAEAAGTETEKAETEQNLPTRDNLGTEQ